MLDQYLVYMGYGTTGDGRWTILQFLICPQSSLPFRRLHVAGRDFIISNFWRPDRENPVAIVRSGAFDHAMSPCPVYTMFSSFQYPKRCTDKVPLEEGDSNLYDMSRQPERVAIYFIRVYRTSFVMFSQLNVLLKPTSGLRHPSTGLLTQGRASLKNLYSHQT